MTDTLSYKKFLLKIRKNDLYIDISEINLYTTTFKLFQFNKDNKVLIGIIDITIRNLTEDEKKYIISKNKIYNNSYTYNIDYIEIYKDKIDYYNSYKGIGTCFYKYCISYVSKVSKQNKKIIKFSTLDNCIDSKGDIYFYKKLGYEWIDFDEIENKPNGPEMIKFL